MDAEQPQCPQCGAIQEDFVYKSRIAAAALAIGFGFFGVHRFYLGQWWGIFYLLFFWTYVPGLIAWIEGIVFLARDQKAWNAKYNKGVFAGNEKGGVLFVILIFVMIAILGILAAIALPAYQDYSNRAKVISAISAAKTTIPQVEQYAYDHQRWPMTEDLTLNPLDNPLLGTLTVNNGAIVVTMDKSTRIDGYVAFIPTSDESGISWSCTESTIKSRFLPAECRPE
ncbi:NINE protein [Pseudoteredinibacter isoporae]|uniref:TM2 domain-containing membrane protein YozV/type II secretory pathway pseudopilin PulG n=1 Tax=Pseudoteredinibacter isoporae TaxID=570281 RepID=A0A7X0JPA1_9GAMM|nr:NINE protein [Pseudoteredinibacter isoporae]MBB6519793.1 TM2 domain-containing membrane protein YozV/type II secretory pathway pseudopilin PulG [Pseudoteredinibacter isoporae]